MTLALALLDQGQTLSGFKLHNHVRRLMPSGSYGMEADQESSYRTGDRHKSKAGCLIFFISRFPLLSLV